MTRIITHFMTHSKPVFGQECKILYIYSAPADSSSASSAISAVNTIFIFFKASNGNGRFTVPLKTQ